MDVLTSAFSKLKLAPTHELQLVKTLAITSFAVYGAYAIHKSLKVPKGSRLPPGPRGIPLLGNARDIPEEDFWQKYKEWSDEYGSDVIYLNVLGSEIVVLNSLEACRELLENRSSIYSSRPDMPMMNDLIGFTWHFGFMPYNDAWKERRKIFQQSFHPTKIEVYRPRLVKAVRTFLLNILEDPSNFRGHSRLLAGAFILDMSYGIDVKDKDDPYILQAERGMAAMAAAGTASTYMVDFFPSLKYIPSWFPGAAFKHEAKAWNRDVTAMPKGSFEYAEKSMSQGNAAQSIARDLLENLDPEEEHYSERKSAIYDVLGSIYAAGSDTVVSSFLTFFVAMIQNPEIQKKGQEVIDDAIAQLGRLPNFAEYKELPYIEAIVREVLRWRPVTPIAVPHKVTEEDVYKGYRIPAGATVLPNAYAISHDPAIYGPNPERFDPARFLVDNETTINPDMPMGYEAFGYGRRICPGIQVAVEAVWLVVVSVLAVYDLYPMEGEREGFVKYSTGMLIHPNPFEMKIVPRSREAVDLIRAGVSEA